MKVNELIKKLETLSNSNQEVFIEGCDCIGFTLDVEEIISAIDNTKYVLITRDHMVDRTDNDD